MTLPETEPWGPDADHVEALRMNAVDRLWRAFAAMCPQAPTTEGDE